MAFVVEDGTGLPDANSYASLEFADDYFAERGLSAWTGTDDQKRAWLVQGTDHIETVFGARLSGSRESLVQGLSFPRVGCYTRQGALVSEDTVPIEFLRACCLYALRAKSAPLLPDPFVTAEGFAVAVTRKKAGPVEKEYRIMGASRDPIVVRSYPAADSLIVPFLVYAGRGVIR